MQSKTIYIQKEQTKQSQTFTIKINKNDQFIDFGPIIRQIQDWGTKVFEIYNPLKDAYIQLDNICSKEFIIPREYVQLDVVMLKYYQEPDKAQSEIPSEENKKQRSKERTIKEVVQLVHRWRDLHDSSVDGKRINLQQAAKVVGVSKKSLDDYFFQLRMGEKYGFDFTGNMNNKIGLLRSFVKEQQQINKNKGKQSNPRHPKKLKIIQEFAEKLHLRDTTDVKLQSQSQKSKVEQQKQEKELSVESPFSLVDSSQLFWGSPFSPINEKAFLDCQNIFFKDFENIMQQPNDPFIPFTSFKKTKSIFGDEQNSSSSLF